MKKFALVLITTILMIGGCTYAPAYRNERNNDRYGRRYEHRPSHRPPHRPSRHNHHHPRYDRNRSYGRY